MTEEKIILSFPCLARESKKDVRVKPEHDKKKNKHGNDRGEEKHRNDKERGKPGNDKENTRHGLTICTQKASRFNKGSRRNQRALKGVPLSSWLQLALYVFLKTSENEGNNKDLGKIF